MGARAGRVDRRVDGRPALDSWCGACGLRLPGLLEGLGDPLDAAQPGVPRRADAGELGHRAGELGLVHSVPLLAPGRSWRAPAPPGRAPRGASPRPAGSRGAARSGWSPCRRRPRGAGRAGAGGSGHRSRTRGRRRRRRSSAAPPAARRTARGGAGSGPSPRRARGTAPRGRRPPTPSRGSRSPASARCVPAPDGTRSKVTSSELPGAAASSAPWTQRKANRRGGSTSSTVIGTVVGSAPPAPNTSSPTAPGLGSRCASSGHHSLRCSGLLITSKTTSGEAATWISRSMLPYSMTDSPSATFGCR